MATKLAKFEFQQGFHRETTPYAEGQRWFDGNYVRFRAGRPENMRGYETRALGETFDGSARDLTARGVRLTYSWRRLTLEISHPPCVLGLHVHSTPTQEKPTGDRRVNKSGKKPYADGMDALAQRQYGCIPCTGDQYNRTASRRIQQRRRVRLPSGPVRVVTSWNPPPNLSTYLTCDV